MSNQDDKPKPEPVEKPDVEPLADAPCSDYLMAHLRIGDVRTTFRQKEVGGATYQDLVNSIFDHLVKTGHVRMDGELWLADQTP